MMKLVEAVLAQHRADVAKALEHGVLHERGRNHAQLAIKSVEVELAKHKLAEERSQTVALLLEMAELRLTANVELEWRCRADDGLRGLRMSGKQWWNSCQKCWKIGL